MESHADRYKFSAAEQQMIDRRVTEAMPAFSSGDDVAELFGKPFSA